MINFQNSSACHTKQDIIFHLSIRPSENTIVRNHFQNDRWGPEERYGGNAIKSNNIFEIIILTDTFGYKVAVNGKHFQNFKHRLPPNLAQFVQISGNCVIEHIILEQNMSPQPQTVTMLPIVTIPQGPRPYYHTNYVVPNYAPPPYHQNSNTQVITVTQHQRHIAGVRRGGNVFRF